MERSAQELEAPSAGNVLSLAGAVTLGVAALIKDSACQRARAGGDVIVSCAGLEEIDASGVQILLALKRELEASGRELELRQVPAQLERTFLLSGLLPLHTPGAG